MTAAKRELIRAARDADARRRVRRDKNLRLSDGVDRDVFCARGLHLRADYERTVTYTSGTKKTFCRGCKADDDAKRWPHDRHPSSKTSWWLPVLPARVEAAAGLLAKPPDLVVIEFGEDRHGRQEGEGL